MKTWTDYVNSTLTEAYIADMKSVFSPDDLKEIGDILSKNYVDAKNSEFAEIKRFKYANGRFSSLPRFAGKYLIAFTDFDDTLSYILFRHERRGFEVLGSGYDGTTNYDLDDVKVLRLFTVVDESDNYDQKFNRASSQKTFDDLDAFHDKNIDKISRQKQNYMLKTNYPEVLSLARDAKVDMAKCRIIEVDGKKNLEIECVNEFAIVSARKKINAFYIAKDIVGNHIEVAIRSQILKPSEYVKMVEKFNKFLEAFSAIKLADIPVV